MRSVLSEIQEALLIISDPNTPPESTVARDKVAVLIQEIKQIQTSLPETKDVSAILPERMDVLKNKRYLTNVY
jgi:hypothetical protein